MSYQLHLPLLVDGTVYLTTRACGWGAPGAGVDLLMALLVALQWAEPPRRFFFNLFSSSGSRETRTGMSKE